MTRYLSIVLSFVALTLFINAPTVDAAEQLELTKKEKRIIKRIARKIAKNKARKQIDAILPLGPDGLAANAVISSKIVDGTITGDDIADGTVDTVDLANEAVISSKIADGTVTGDDIADDTISGADIANGAIDTAELASEAVTTNKIMTGAVTTSEIATDAVTSVKVQDGAVTEFKLAPSVKPAGVDFVTAASSGVFLAASGGADTLVAAVTVTAPAAGFVIVNVTGWFDFNSSAGHARCSVTTALFVQSTSALRSRVEPFATPLFVPMARSRVFPVLGPGSATYNLVCDKQSGTVDINDIVMTAIYVPQQL